MSGLGIRVTQNAGYRLRFQVGSIQSLEYCIAQGGKGMDSYHYMQQHGYFSGVMSERSQASSVHTVTPCM